MNTKLTSAGVLLGVLASSTVAFGAYNGNGSFKLNLSDEVKAEIETCKTNNEDDREATKACINAMFETNGIERPAMPFKNSKGKKHALLPILKDVSDEVKAELQACRDSDTHRTCMKSVLEAAGIELPKQPKPFIANISAEIKTELEACRTNNEGDREAGKACANAIFKANGIEKPEHIPFGRRGRHENFEDKMTENEEE